MLTIFSKYVFQNIFAMIGLSIYILADTFFIALRSGTDGLAALNLILPLFGLIYAIGSMIGIGSASKFSIKKARGENTDFYFMQSITWCLICSLPFVLVGMFVPHKVLALMGADENLITLGEKYIQIILIAAPVFMSNFTFTAFLRNDNAPKTAMLGSIAGSLFNVVFDYILMFPMGLGFTGAALATAMSPIVTMLVCSSHFFKPANHIVFKWKLPQIHSLFSCCKFGIPAFVGEMTVAITTITFNTLILGITGNIGVAAYGVIANIALVAMCIFNGIAQGSQPLISNSYGRGNKKELHTLLKLGTATSLIIMLFILTVIWSSTDALINVFNTDGNAILHAYAFEGMRLYFLGFIFASVNIFLVSYFAAINNAKIAFIGSFSRGAIAIILCAVILSKMFGMTGVWLSFIASELITFILILILYRLQKSNNRMDIG